MRNRRDPAGKAWVASNRDCVDQDFKTGRTFASEIRFGESQSIRTDDPMTSLND